MINATTTPTPSANPTPTNAGVPQAQFDPNRKKDIKIFGFELKPILTVLGLTAFFIVSMLGVIIALRQRQVTGPVAPTAPESRPAAAQNQKQRCSLSFTVAGEPEAVVPNIETLCTDDNQPIASVSWTNFPSTAGYVVDLNPANPGTASAWSDYWKKTVPGSTTSASIPDGFTFAIGQGDDLTELEENKQYWLRVYNISNDSFSKVVSFTTETCTTTVISADLACVKRAYKDEGLSAADTLTKLATNELTLTSKSTFMPGDVVLYLVDPTQSSGSAATVNLIDQLSSNLEYIDSAVCDANSFNSTTSTLTCPITLNQSSSEVEERRIIRAKIKDTVADGTTISNVATLTDTTNASNSAECEVDITVEEPAPKTCGSECSTDNDCNNGLSCNGGQCVLDECLLPGATCNDNRCERTFGCNSRCETNEQCASNQVCTNQGGDYKVCRLESNVSSTSCTAAPSTPVPTPTPTVGCNDTCATNADCSNSNHICYQSQCRLDSNPTNQYCAPQQVVQTQSPASPDQQQPELPEELPQTGFISQFMMAGMGIFLAGAALLLLL